MISFQLQTAHPFYQRVIPATYKALCIRYPFAPLKQVSLYESETPNDTSMGAAYPGGVIKLNAYWFSTSPDRLNDAAKRDPPVETGRGMIRWHGVMDNEPEQVLTHEFAHIVEQAAPEMIGRWSKEKWLAATKNPMLAPSGYALSIPAEFFAESFALYALGLASARQAREMSNLLAWIA